MLKVGDRVVVSPFPRVLTKKRLGKTYEQVNSNKGGEYILRGPYTIAEVREDSKGYWLKDKDGAFAGCFYYKDVFPYTDWKTVNTIDKITDINIEVRGRSVKASFTHGGELLVGEARCHKDDVFSISVGVAIATRRLREEVVKYNNKITNSRFEVGDEVTVTKPGFAYSNYLDWIMKLGDISIAAAYQFNNPLETALREMDSNRNFTILAKQPHLTEKDTMLYAIKDKYGRVFIISGRGIEKVYDER